MASDRFSASVINARKPELFNYIDGGFVFDADAAQDCLLCSYPTDGHSAWFRCKPPNPPGLSTNCIPGCPSPGTTGSWKWCQSVNAIDDVRGCEKGCPNGCAFKPEQLHDMLLTWSNNAGKARGYSELIFDSECITKRKYPGLIRGVFFQAAGNKFDRNGYENLNGGDSDAAEREARRTRIGFAEAFGLRLQDVPLLRFDLASHAAPFTLVPNVPINT